MAYKETIPKPTDKLRVSQNDLLNNFAANKIGFDFNHVTFDLANQGKHKWLSFPEQGAAPAVAADEIGLYSKLSTLTSIAELFVKNESGEEYEFTSSLQGPDGWTRLPSGILLKWGSDNVGGAGTVTFPVAGTIPVYVGVFIVLLTVINAGAGDTDQAVKLVSSANATFDVYASKRSTSAADAVSFQYLAIGV